MTLDYFLISTGAFQIFGGAAQVVVNSIYFYSYQKFGCPERKNHAIFLKRRFFELCYKNHLIFSMQYFLFQADTVFRPVRIFGNESHRLRLFLQLIDILTIMRCIMMCPVCNSENTIRNGSIRNGKPEFRCRQCGKQGSLPTGFFLKKSLLREQQELPGSRSGGCKAVSVINMRIFRRWSQ